MSDNDIRFFIWSLIPFLMNMRLQSWRIPRSLLVVSLATVRHSCRFSYSFWTWLNSHNRVFFIVKHINFPFIRRMKLRHLDFRKIGVNCRRIQELNFKHNDMPMAPPSLYKPCANTLNLTKCHNNSFPKFSDIE